MTNYISPCNGCGKRLDDYAFHLGGFCETCRFNRGWYRGKYYEVEEAPAPILKEPQKQGEDQRHISKHDSNKETLCPQQRNQTQN